ncbi:MAG: hypothetical protein JXA51_06275 [Dehalococcoidales bacterium]|nr:hypothetical protein [Dehalococcoidales bacterium]
MVEDTGKTLRADTYRPVNVPDAVKVEEDASGHPVAVGEKQRQAVTAIEDRWRIDDEWWRAEPVTRLYYNVLLASGQRLVLYKDLATGGWYEQDY